jgi:hypothetical protein
MRLLTDFGAPKFHPANLMAMSMLFIIGSAMLIATQWDFSAKIVPLVVGTVGFSAAAFSLFNDMFRRETEPAGGLEEQIEREVEERMRKEAAREASLAPAGGMTQLAMAAAGAGTVAATGAGPSAGASATADPKKAQARIQAEAERLHMDIESDTKHLPVKTIALRGARFFAYLVAFMAVMAVIGLVPTAGLFVVFFMRYENQEPWRIVIPYAIVLMLSVSLVFDYIMSIPWPPTLIAQWFPALKILPSI